MAIGDQIASVFNGSNVTYLANLYAKWKQDATSIDPSFAQIFSVMNDAQTVIMNDLKGASWTPHYNVKSDHINEEVLSPKKNKIDEKALYQAAYYSLQATQLINAYRRMGHFNAILDPLALHRSAVPVVLNPETYGFQERDLDRPIFFAEVTKNFLPGEIHTLREVILALQKCYCRSLAWEYVHLYDPQQRQWWMEAIETGKNIALSIKDKKQILYDLAKAVGFEVFCQKRYVGVKRFGLDGGETLIPALSVLIQQALTHHIRSIGIGMAHRGRLNVLTHTVGKPLVALLSEFAGNSYKPSEIPGAGDVKYHLGYRKEIKFGEQKIDISLDFNPSHLEAVNPVVEGRIRARQDQDQCAHLPVLIHGDAAFAGQGVVYETLAMSQLPGYKTGGTIHIVANNQIGFTTSQEYAYSGYYCTDVAKVAKAPIIHVNGDDPEAVVSAIKLAVEYRISFATDVVVDIVCYRRFGHNETDEPSFTQPIMYQAIRQYKNIYQLYATQLQKEGVISESEAEKVWAEYQNCLQDAYTNAKDYVPSKLEWLPDEWQNMQWSGKGRQNYPTAVSINQLKEIGQAISQCKKDFACHPKLLRQLEMKAKMFQEEKNIDWATGEALAFGSLLLEGHPVRFSGEDSQRGTFSHRNAVLFDQKTQQAYVPLNHIAATQSNIEIHNSLLSEFAVLGFEYGYSCENANALVVWEAQFGDFVNGAQIIIDQFIAAGESKWLQQSALVLLLPHAQEGQGAEHSSARLERFLQLCAEENMQVCNFTTPANYFHALRRQLKRNYRQPLVVMSPKSLLRHPWAQSDLVDFAEGSRFSPVIDEIETDQIKIHNVNRVVLCSGKVYYDLLKMRRDTKKNDIALLRIEQLYPFPMHELKEILRPYQKVEEWIWCQEEPKNMGAWSFVFDQVNTVVQGMQGPGTNIQYIGRPRRSSPTAGLMSVHTREQEQVLKQALALT